MPRNHNDRIWAAAFAGMAIGAAVLATVAIAVIVVERLMQLPIWVVAFALGAGTTIGAAAELAKILQRRDPPAATIMFSDTEPSEAQARGEIPWDRHDPFSNTVYGDSEDDHK